MGRGSLPLMPELEKIIAEAERAIRATSTIAELEQAKARFLGKAGSLTELAEGTGQALAEEGRRPAPPSTRPRRGRGAWCSRSATRSSLRELDARLAAESDRRDAPGTPPGAGRAASHHARAGARGEALRDDGLLGGRRPRDRERLVQLHRAAHVPGPSVAQHAGHVLRRGHRSTCCARRLHPCRSATCSPTSRRSASSARAACTAATTTRRTRRCSTRSRACGWTRA